jgi:peptidoglycan/xylan/chitin deacetylase (PgdA/CDA1 family)
MATLLCLASLCVLVLLPFYIIYKPPAFVIRYFAYHWPDVLWQVSFPANRGGKPDKVVALTIDDAPSEYTREILALLQENDAHATFFIIGGQVSGREEILQEMVRAGHELGNHAMHDEAARALGSKELQQQMLMVQEMIKAAYVAEGTRSGPEHKFFRPGSGFFSDKMRALIKEMDFKLVLGSIYPHDAQISYWGLNAKHILSMLKPGGIIICHDRRSWTLPMLRRVLPEMKKRGYRIVTVTDLLKEAER